MKVGPDPEIHFGPQLIKALNRLEPERGTLRTGGIKVPPNVGVKRKRRFADGEPVSDMPDFSVNKMPGDAVPVVAAGVDGGVKAIAEPRRNRGGKYIVAGCCPAISGGGLK
jgi:hypothetical protein